MAVSASRAGSSRSGSSGWSPWDCPCGRPPRRAGRGHVAGGRLGAAVRVCVPGRGRDPRGRGRPAATVGRICLPDGPDDGGGGRSADVRDRARPPARRRSPDRRGRRAPSHRSAPRWRPSSSGASCSRAFRTGATADVLCQRLADVTALLRDARPPGDVVRARPDRRPVASAAGRQPVGSSTRSHALTPPQPQTISLAVYGISVIASSRHPRPPLPPFGRRHPRAGPVGRRRRDRADRAVPGDLHRRQRRPRWRRRRAVVGLDPVDGPAASRDRRRDPALPPLRHRPHHQPHDRLRRS